MASRNTALSLRTCNFILVGVVMALGIFALYSLLSEGGEGTSEGRHIEANLSEAKTQHDIAGWRYLCPDEQEKKKDALGCRAKRSFQTEDGHSLSVSYAMTARPDGETVPRLSVRAPLGTFLPLGLTLTLPEQQPMTAPFQFCDVHGCVVNLDLSVEVIEAMANAPQLDVLYHTPNRQKAAFSVPLEALPEILIQLTDDYSSER